jgi:hypothetical protein
MATNFTLTLDTTAPASVSASINSGAAFTTSQTVTLGITSPDSDSYQMKIWGNVDLANDASVQDTEANSAWISFATTKSVKLSTGDGVKTLTVRVRDDVGNESSTASDTITLDTTAPVPNITVAADHTKISKIAGFRTSTFSWAVDQAFEEYKVKVVSSASDPNTAGTTIGTTNGSTNTSGTAGGYPASTNITTAIDGRDLEAASAGDGAKIIKVFARDSGGNWSV